MLQPGSGEGASERTPRDTAAQIPALPTPGGRTHLGELLGCRGSHLFRFQVENKLSTSRSRQISLLIESKISMIAATEVEPQIILDTSELPMGPFPRYFYCSVALSLKKENKKKPKKTIYLFKNWTYLQQF